MRKLLFPFSILYGAIIWLRNKLFDAQIKKSVEFEIPVISIGNLSTGGTGKTPHTEYLLKLLSQNYQCGVLSRGYGRRSNGYIEVTADADYKQTGDEPLQIKNKFNDVLVSVCEERVIGIAIMIVDEPKLQTIILDDAFQHRQVKPGLSILLSDYSKLFTRDQVLPMGNLREQKSNASRADVIVITKCSLEISEKEKEEIRNEVRSKENQPVFFSSLKYGKPFSLFENQIAIELSKIENAVLITGIASSHHLFNYLQSFIPNLKHEKFNDHHNFSFKELNEIAKKYPPVNGNKTIFLTTEKDGVRLFQFKDFFISHQLEIYCMPVEVAFSATEKEKFDSIVLDFVKSKLAEENL